MFGNDSYYKTVFQCVGACEDAAPDGAGGKNAAPEVCGRADRRYFSPHRLSWAAIGYCTGLLLAERTLFWPALGILLLALLWLFCRRQPAEFLLCLLLAALGVYAMTERQAVPPCWQALLGQEITVTGRVQESTDGKKYLWLRGMWEDEAELLCVTLPPARGEEAQIYYPAGSRLQVRGRLTLPEGPHNPGGFDETAWYRGKGARYKLAAREVEVLEGPKGLYRAAYLVRRAMLRTAEAQLPPREAGLLLAVLLGERQRLDPAFYRLTQRMGIAHIFAVSGLHVGFVGGAVLFLLHLLRLRAWPSLLCLSAVVGFYCLLAALTPSVLRAAVMLILLRLALSLRRPTSGIDALSAAALLLLWQEPFLLWQAGFQLSFGVTLALLLLAAPFSARLSRIPFRPLSEGLAVAAAAFLGGLPITLWHFYRLSLLAPLCNLLLVPMVSVLVPLALAAFCVTGLCGAAGWLIFLPVRLVAAVLLRAVALLGGLGGWWNLGRPSAAAITCYLLFLALLLLYLRFLPRAGLRAARTRRCMALSILVMLVCSIWLLWPHPAAEDSLLYLDTGQGSCALLRTRAGETILFDGGAQEGEVANTLAWYGVNRVQAMIVSHGDADHILGLGQVLETVAVENLCLAAGQEERDAVRPLTEFAEARGAELRIIRARADLRLRRGEVRLAVYDDGGRDNNSHTLTAILEQNGVRAAFPGDLGLRGVREFVAEAPRIDIWTVPHHGSRNSADAELYRMLRRKGVRCAVISAGRNNRYGHPHAETLSYLRRESLPWYCTQDGAVLFALKRVSAP